MYDAMCDTTHATHADVMHMIYVIFVYTYCIDNGSCMHMHACYLHTGLYTSTLLTLSGSRVHYGTSTLPASVSISLAGLVSHDISQRNLDVVSGLLGSERTSCSMFVGDPCQRHATVMVSLSLSLYLSLSIYIYICMI